MYVKDCKLLKPITCKKNENVVNIAKKLKRSKKKHIVVVDGERPVGIISMVDIVNKVVAVGENPSKLKAIDIITFPIYMAKANDTVARVYAEMLKRSIFSCPVVEKKKLKGILTLSEVMNHLIKRAKENVKKKLINKERTK